MKKESMTNLAKSKKQQSINMRVIILLLSFLLPTLILFISYMVNNFYPVGNRSPLTIDLYHQYVAFLSEMRRKILEGESIFYSWNIGLGTNFYALTAYYAASPLNILLILFPKNRITDAVLILTIIKIGLIGLSFAYMLLEGPVKRLGKYSIRAKDKVISNSSDDIATDIFVVILSTLFALNGFNLAYSWDIMWLDAIVLLPIVVLGVNRVIRESRHGLYIISLGLTLIVNYYMAFFICIFTALYFFVAYITAYSDKQILKKNLAYARIGREAEDNLTNSNLLTTDMQNLNTNLKKALDKKDTLEINLLALKFWPVVIKFTIATLIAVALSAIMLLPTFISLADTSAAGDVFPKEMRLNFDSFDFLGRALINMPANIRSGLPNIYMGILSFVFLPLYIFSGKISAYEKLGHLGLLGFLFVSFNNNFLDFIWHGMHYPNQLPYRYAFLFSFVMLLIIFKTLTIIREYSPRTLMILTGAAIIVVSLIEKLNEDLTRQNALINILFFLVYMGIFAVYRKPRYFRTASLILAIVIVGELSINTLVTIHNIGENEVYTSRSSFIEGMEDVSHLIQRAKDNEDGNFYRMEILPQKTTNDGALYGYPGFTLFSSTSREDTAKLFRKLGYHGNDINSYKYTASTALANSLLGIKYQLLKNGASRDTGLELVEEYNDMKLLYNPFALEVGLPTGKELSNWNPNNGSPFQNFNNLMIKLGETSLFQHLTPTVIDGYNYGPANGGGESGLVLNPEDYNNSSLMNLKINVEQDEYVYLAIDTNKDTKVKIRINENNLSNQGINENGEVVSRDSEATVKLEENRTIHWIETFDLGYAKAGDVIDISLENEQDKASSLTIYAASMDKNLYEAAMKNLQSRKIDVQEWSSNYLKAQYNAFEDGYLYLNIPYDSSWKAYIDGKEAKIKPLADKALLMVETTKGEHKLELRFVPKGFNQGLLLSLGGILLVIVIIFLEQKFNRRSISYRLEIYRKHKNVNSEYNSNNEVDHTIENESDNINLIKKVSEENILGNYPNINQYISNNGNAFGYREYEKYVISMSIEEINRLYDIVKLDKLKYRQIESGYNELLENIKIKKAIDKSSKLDATKNHNESKNEIDDVNNVENEDENNVENEDENI